MWLTDFEWGPGSVLVKKTGVRLALNRELLAETGAWFMFYAAIKLRSVRRIGRRPVSVAFCPDRIRPWYLAWAAATEAGLRFVSDPSQADIIFHFDDSTTSTTTPPAAKPESLLINFGCGDVSKSRVADVFEAVFGYSLRVDPRTHAGPAVEKSEVNGAHDGRIVFCPVEPLPGRVYQKLINNRFGSDLVQDLRTPTVGGRPACVFLKRRAASARFKNANSEVVLTTPEQVFSSAELAMIERFAEKLGLDWGGLDVLRDADDGRIYIVDANKTDMGPPTALPLRDKLTATRQLARALDSYVNRSLKQV